MFFTGKLIIDIANFAAQQGINRQSVLAASTYEESQLKQDAFYVDYHCMARVFAVIKEKKDSVCFGLLMGEQFDLLATQYTDQIINQSATVREAFEAAIAYSRLISDSMVCSLEIEEEYFCVNFELNPDWALQNDYAIIQNLDMALICTKNSLARLTKRAYFPTAVHFHYPKPKKLSNYYRLFNCRLKFNAKVAAIYFEKHLLKKKVKGHDLGLLNQLKSEANNMLTLLQKENPLITQVKKSILSNITPKSFNIDHVAMELNITPRTLQRRLSSQNTSFMQILNEIRFQLIKKIIAKGENNLDEIAYLAGYSEASALIRAFKKWSGVSPKKYFATL